ncbi:MAG: hypothetical protein NC347_15545 [Clostridium sp.]|nr:hypothetical protein [Clostridium sp.]
MDMDTAGGHDYAFSFPVRHEKPEREKDYNPFTDCYEYLPAFEEADRSATNSLNRTKNEIYKYSRQCAWEYFITLTFDGAKTDRYDFDACMKKSRKWFEHQRERFAPDLKFLYVPEEHKKGGWHVHGLVADVGNMSFVDSGRVSVGGKACLRDSSNCNCPVIYNLAGWNFGFSTATKVTDYRRVSTYITKYISKELVAKTPYRHRYFRSRNIPEPEESNYIVDFEADGKSYEEFVEMLENSLGLEVSYEKSVTGLYNSVDYKFYEERR